MFLRLGSRKLIFTMLQDVVSIYGRFSFPSAAKLTKMGQKWSKTISTSIFPAPEPQMRKHHQAERFWSGVASAPLGG